MYQVTFALKNSPNVIALTFKAHAEADRLYNRAATIVRSHEQNYPQVTHLDATDDYNLRLCVAINDVAAVQFSDVEVEMDKQGEFQILQARSNVKTSNFARQDNLLKLRNTNTLVAG